MKLTVFNEGQIGIIDDDRVVDVTSLTPETFNDWPEQRMNWVIRNWDDFVEATADLSVFPSISMGQARLKGVNLAPPQLFAIPANFHAHIGELGNRAITPKNKSGADARFFLKAAGSVSGPTDGILLPRGSARRFDHECELGVVIGTGGSNIAREDAFKHIFGYTCLIDMTMRIEKGSFEEDRSLRKSFSTFTPTGPYLVTADEIADPTTLSSRLLVNGEVRQAADLRDMIVSIDEAIELISSVVPLQPGDLIAAGTPKGVGPVAVGDEVEIAIDQIGSMTLRVSESQPLARPF